MEDLFRHHAYTPSQSAAHTLGENSDAWDTVVIQLNTMCLSNRRGRQWHVEGLARGKALRDLNLHHAGGRLHLQHHPTLHALGHLHGHHLRLLFVKLDTDLLRRPSLPSRALPAMGDDNASDDAHKKAT